MHASSYFCFPFKYTAQAWFNDQNPLFSCFYLKMFLIFLMCFCSCFLVITCSVIQPLWCFKLSLVSTWWKIYTPVVSELSRKAPTRPPGEMCVVLWAQGQTGSQSRDPNLRTSSLSVASLEVQKSNWLWFCQNWCSLQPQQLFSLFLTCYSCSLYERNSIQRQLFFFFFLASLCFYFILFILIVLSALFCHQKVKVN